MKNKLKLKKGDNVIVLAGKDKGKQGSIIRSIPSENRVVVAGVNMVTRHQRQTHTSEGGLIRKEAPIHVSNVAYVDPKEKKATRIGYKTLEDGKKVRVAKLSGEVING